MSASNKSYHVGTRVIHDSLICSVSVRWIVHRSLSSLCGGFRTQATKVRNKFKIRKITGAGQTGAAAGSRMLHIITSLRRPREQDKKYADLAR